MATAVLALASCGQTGAPVGEPSGDWHRVDGAPLGPREGATGVWTGEEVLLFGGRDARPCPPNADCVMPEKPPLADGAAYRPATRQWRRLPDAPVGFQYADTVLIDDTVYLWIPGVDELPGAPRAFLAYQTEQNRWHELPLPPDHTRAGYGVVATGDRIVFYAGSDETGERSDQVYNPARRAWTELPADPLSPSFDRTMVWAGDRLVLFDHELVANPGSERPAVTRAAVLDIAAGTWRRLPDSELLTTGPWIPVDGKLVNPSLGSADGGEVNNWGRTYPYGGILDPDTGEWSALPDPPEVEGVGGVLTPSSGHFADHHGWVLDTATDRWIWIPELDDRGYVQSRTMVSAGRDLFLFGGARFADIESNDGELLNEAWSWSPSG